MRNGRNTAAFRGIRKKIKESKGIVKKMRRPSAKSSLSPYIAHGKKTYGKNHCHRENVEFFDTNKILDLDLFSYEFERFSSRPHSWDSCVRHNCVENLRRGRREEYAGICRDSIRKFEKPTNLSADRLSTCNAPAVTASLLIPKMNLSTKTFCASPSRTVQRGRTKLIIIIIIIRLLRERRTYVLIDIFPFPLCLMRRNDGIYMPR